MGLNMALRICQAVFGKAFSFLESAEYIKYIRKRILDLLQNKEKGVQKQKTEKSGPEDGFVPTYYEGK